MSIPKIIHYCWFGGKPLPVSAKKCIESWKKFFPDYEIRRWDESNYNVNKISYTRDAYAAKKFAFVSDYARFDILYQYGGLYFDTDVEIIRPMEDIIMVGSFMGCEHPYQPGASPDSLFVNPGLGLGLSPGLGLNRKILDYYESTSFIMSGGHSNPETVVTHTTRLLCQYGLKNTSEIQEVEGIRIYPVDYFCPISTADGKMRITDNTRSIHHYDQSWQSPWRKYGRKLLLAFGGVKLKTKIKKIIFK